MSAVAFLRHSLTALVFGAGIASAHAAGEPALKLEATIPLPNVKGRIDHFAIDMKRQRLFVAALGNDTVEIVDLKQKRREKSLRGFGEPQGIAYVPLADRIYVANGHADRVDVYDAKSLARTQRFDALEGADNVRVDGTGRLLLVGYGKGALRIIDVQSGNSAANIKLSGHPESFQLEEAGNRIFVNVPTEEHVAVIDIAERAVIATWPTAPARGNFPMALDEFNHRLFVGARTPPLLQVYDTDTGKIVAQLPIGEDTDDIFLDPDRKRAYVICGEGRIDIFRQDTPDRYTHEGSVKTAPRARTGLFVPGQGELYVAAPAAGTSPARVFVYGVQ
jgi:DNA-binding beta-propeller fold protein YncE